MIRYNTKRYWGYSGDTKPINAQIGDRFLELDTKNEYFFGNYNSWNLIGGAGGTNPTSGYIPYNNGGIFDDSNIYYDGISNLGIGTISPSVKFDVVGNDTTKNTVQFGTIGIQSYNTNNAWFGDNVYFNGAQFIRRNNGYSGLFYFAGNEGQFRFGDNNSAGTAITDGYSTYGRITLKTNLNGTFAVGDLNYPSNDYTGANFIVNSSGNVGIGTISPTNKLHVSGSTNPLRLQGLTASTTDTKILSVDNNGEVHSYSLSGLTGGTSISGAYLPLSGGTVTGNTTFTSGLTAGTLNVTGNTNVSGRTTTSGITSTGSITFPQKFVSTSYTATTSDYLIDVTAGTNLTITLPDCTTIPGRLYVIKNNFDAQVTVVGTSGQTIDGASSIRLGETNSLSVASNGVYWVSIGVSTGTAPIPVSTGVYSFTGMTAATSGTTFYVSPLKGYIVNDLSPTAPTVTFINFTGGTYSATGITTTTETWIYCDVNGVIQQQNTSLTEQQRRQNIFLGKLGHANKQYIVNVFNAPDQILSSLAQFRDMFEPIGYVNGGDYPSANTGLTMNTSAGYLYGLGINFVSSNLNPNRIAVNSQNPTTFQYRTQTGGTALNTTLVDPLNWDVNGVVTPIVGTKATNQRVYLLANGQIRIQYGQTTYNQLSAAIAGIQTETFNTFSNFYTNGILIGIISILSTADNTVGGGLDDPNKAQIFFVSKFGETVGAAGGLATTTLQKAYTNSSDPEIITDSTRGALVIQRGSASDDDDVLQIQTATGVHTFAINGSGKTTTTTLLVTGSTNPVTISNLSSSANTRFIVSDSNGVLTYRTDVLTGSSSISAVTLSSANVLSVTSNGGSPTATTINAVTGGTYSSGTITLNGTGSLSTSITGLNTGTVTSITSGTGMNFNNITSTGSISIDTTKVPYYSTGFTSGLPRYNGSIWTWDTNSYLTGITSSNVTTALGYIPVNPTRSISTTSPLSGGGDLSADRTLSITQATTSTNGYLSSTDWNTFNGKQNTITLTITGSSGSSTFGSNVLNVPTYTLSGLGGQPLSTNLSSLSGLTYSSTSFVKMTGAGTFALDTNTYLTGITSSNVTTALGYTPVTNARFLSINGVQYDLSADRTWSVGDLLSSGSYSNPSWLTALAWSKITNTPTTIAGYGITDAVPTGRTLTINGTSNDLSTNRSWSVGTITSITSGTGMNFNNITSSGSISIDTTKVPYYSTGFTSGLPRYNGSIWTWDTNSYLTNAITGSSQSVNTLTLNNLTGSTTYTPNAATGGTYSNGTISLSGTGTLGTITGLTKYFISGSTPSGTINNGDRWFDTTNGVELVYINDGDSSQWVQPNMSVNATINGTFSATTINAETISASTYSNLPNTLYTGDGNISGNRTVSLGSNILKITGGSDGNLFVLSGANISMGTTIDTTAKVAISTSGIALKVTSAQGPAMQIYGGSNNNNMLTFYTTGLVQKSSISKDGYLSIGTTDTTYAINVGSGTISGNTLLSQTITASSLTLSSSASTINLTNTSQQQIKFFSGGTGTPQISTYSAGAKIILYDNIDSSSSTGFAIGVDTGTLWYGTDLSGNGHEWYSGTRKLSTLIGANGFQLYGLGSPTTAAMTISGTSSLGSKGGVGYMDFLRVFNNFSGATNANKWFRTNSAGTLQILRDDYNATIFDLTNNGILSVGGGNIATSTSSDGTSNYLSFNNNNSQIYDDGNFHIHSRTANQVMWINTNGGGINIGTQSPVSGGAIASSINCGTGTVTGYFNINTGRTFTDSRSYGYLITGGSGTYGGGSQSITVSLYASNRIWGQEIDAFSDERLKDIQGEVTLDDGLKLVNNLKPIKYTWKDDEDKGLKVGYSAQQVSKSGFDHLVALMPREGLEETIDDDGFVSPKDTQFSMNYDQVVPYHGVVIKHLLDKIEQLEKEIKELKNK